MQVRRHAAMIAIYSLLHGCGPTGDAPKEVPSQTSSKPPQRFAPGDCFFTIEAPVSGWKRSEESADLPGGGKLVAIAYEAVEPTTQVKYAVGCTTFPKEAEPDPKTRDADLDRAVRSAVEPYGGTDIKAEPIKLAEFSGRSITFDVPLKAQPGKAKGRSRIYLVNNRLYSVTTIRSPNGPEPADVSNFFTSFLITKK